MPWWRHRMETVSALLAFCAGSSPVTGEFPSQRPVTQSFGFFFDLRLNHRLSKPSRSQWFETPSHSLWRHCYVIRQSVIRFGISKPVGNVTGWLGRSRRTLLYSPSPEAFKLSVGYETWPPIGFLWLACREMGWNRFGYNGLWNHVTDENFRRFLLTTDHRPQKSLPHWGATSSPLAQL